MPNIKSYKNEKREETITIRCSKKEKDRLMLASERRGMSLSTYLLQTGLSGCMKGRYRDRILISRFVDLQNNINRLLDHQDKENLPKDIVEDIKNIKEGVDALWVD